MYKIAICDDDKRYRKTIREIIEHENSLPENEIRFYEYESGNELLKHTDILHELVFIDIRMPGLDGNQTALKLRNYNKDAVLIFYSSYFEPTVDSINFGQPFRYIMKDLHDTSLRRERPNGELMEHQLKMLNILFRVFSQNFRCVSTYEPKPYYGNMRILCCEIQGGHFYPGFFAEDYETWKPYAKGNLTFDLIKGWHLDCITEPNLGENIKKMLDFNY